MGDLFQRRRVLAAAAFTVLAGAPLVALGQPSGLEDATTALPPLLPRPLYLAAESGAVDGVAGHGNVKYLLPDVDSDTGVLAQVERLGSMGPEAVSPQWFTPGVWRDEMVILGDTQADVYLAATANAGARVVVSLDEIRPDGVAVAIVEGSAALPMGGSGAQRVTVTLETDGFVLQAAHALRFSIAFEDAHLASLLVYGRMDAASGLPGLALQIRDRDGDGLGDTAERRLLSDPHHRDGDGDGHPDPVEVFAGSDPLDGKSVPPRLRIDSDDDGIADRAEARFGTDPLRADTDGDGVSDGVEARLGYDPLDAHDRPADADADSVPDALEAGWGLDPQRGDTDGNGVLDGDEDPDGDGVPTRIEVADGTHPFRADTDGDGRSDGAERAARTDPHVGDPAPARGGGWLLPAGLTAAGGAVAAGAVFLARRLRG